MLTKMTEETWTLAVDIFRQVGPRRGQKGADDRRFLEALHYFTVHNITWRALPETFGNWNAIWKRFSRLSRNGTFEAFFRALVGCSRTAAVIQMFDSTTARAHVSAAGAKKGGHQALGRSRGGFGTKIHIKCDLDGLPLDFHLTGAEASDSPQFEILFNDELDATPRAAIADKGYDAKYNRDAAWEKGCVPVIPRRSNSKAKGRFFPRKIYKLRAQGHSIQGFRCWYHHESKIQAG
jgi:transposase